MRGAHHRTTSPRRDPVAALTLPQRAALEDAAGSLLLNIDGRWRPQNHPQAQGHPAAVIDVLVKRGFLFVLDENNSRAITGAGRRLAMGLRRRRATFARMRKIFHQDPPPPARKVQA